MRKLNRSKFFLPQFFLALITAALLSACAPAPAPTGEITSIELEQRLAADSAPLILDVRSADEYNAGHLPGAVNIPHTEVMVRLAELPSERDTEIVIHCHSGKRAGIAQTELEAAGFSNIRHLDGDYIGWKEAGLTLE